MADAPTMWIEFTNVSFRRRDIRNITDPEYWDIFHRIVYPEWLQARRDGVELEAIQIETDYVDTDRNRYVVTTRHRDTSADTVAPTEAE